jgi:RNA polymerase sigma-70 factor, ECF subfamily
LVASPPFSSSLSVIDEEQLIQSILKGDSAAYGILVERYQNRLLHCVLSVISDADEAEDVVQESFVQAYVKLNTFQQNSQFFTWLYRIAFNFALTRRRRKRHVTSLDQARDVNGSEPVSSNEAPDHQMRQNESVQQVRLAMSKLSDDHRIILNLREMEDLSYERLAEILEISIGTVRSRLSRARNALKEQLERQTDWTDK